MKTLKILLAAFLVGAATADCFADEAQVHWARPVKADKEYKQVKEGTNDTVTYYFRKGEWFETTAEDSGDIIYGSDILKTDGASIFELAKRDTLSNHAVMDLASRLKIVDDRIMYLNFGDFEKADSVYILRESDGVVVKVCCLNANDSIVFGDKTLDRKAVVRISPENNLSEIVNLAGIESETSTPPVQDEQNNTAADAKNDNSIFLYIVICVLALIAIAEGALLFKKASAGKKEPDYEDENGDNSGEGEGERSGDTEGDMQQAAALVKNIGLLKLNLCKLTAENTKLKNSLEKAKSSLETEQADRKAIIEAEVSKIQAETESKLNKLRQKVTAAEQKAETIRGEVTAKFENQIAELQSQIQNLKDDLKGTKTKLRETESSLTAETAAHNQSKRKIESLSASIVRFDTKLGDAEFARPYCEIIEKLLEVSAKIQTAANTALNADVEDPYFIFKAIARFTSQIEEVRLPAFYTDVDLVLQTGFVPKGTPLATFDPSLPKTELENRVKNYFFASYLKKYINAVVVLNESMAGLSHLLPDMPTDMVRPFERYRSELEAVFSELGIKVLSVKIFDYVHNNTDLLATQIDAGFDTPGVILDIENCLVSLAGSPKDGERIHVKVQQ